MRRTFHKHIDNGGVSITIKTDDYHSPSIKIEASYFGYPAVSATLANYGQLDANDLAKIGEMFVAAADELRHIMKTVDVESTSS